MTVTMKPSAEAIRKWLQSVINDPDSRRRVLNKAALNLKTMVQVYPAAGPWNSAPGTRGDNVWYQRGFGTRRLGVGGTVGQGGYKSSGLTGRNTSQRLQKSWQDEVSTDATSASVFTGVTYAPYLYDPEKRVNWAASHGWQDTSEIAENFIPRFEQLVSDEIDAQIERPID